MSYSNPVARLVADQVPVEFRTWVEGSLINPLNRFMAPVALALSRMMLGQLNIQVLEAKLTVPSSWTNNALEFQSHLTGPCAGIIPIACAQLDASGQPATPIGALALPVWDERAATDRAAGTKLRILSQAGITAASRYRVRWLALGS